MDDLSSAIIPLECRENVRSNEKDLVVTKTAKIGKAEIGLDFQTQVDTPYRVTEAEYWDKYYSHPDIIYEWNNGILEEKAVSDKTTNSRYRWLFELIGYYLKTYPIGELIYLETGFRLVLSQTTVIRRPDFGVILYTNSVPYEPNDYSYKGTCDFCVEALSDLKPEDIERDTVQKFGEYEKGGIPEYYILDGKDSYQEFYYLNPQRVYVPMTRVKGDIIQSKVLPGFQFRISDLSKQPSIEEMIEDSVYQKFVLPGYLKEKKARQALETQVFEEKKARQALEAQAIEEKKARFEEKKARQAAEEQIKRLEAEMARLKRNT